MRERVTRAGRTTARHRASPVVLVVEVPASSVTESGQDSLHSAESVSGSSQAVAESRWTDEEVR